MKIIWEFISEPWPWYVAGPLIGLMVPLLLVLGNKPFGISSSLRHICAACVPMDISFFRYDWRKESWNLFFVAGVLVGGIIAGHTLMSGEAIVVSDKLKAELLPFGITDYSRQVPVELFNFAALTTMRGLVLMVVGGFLVGFGTRYAGGCTSGHSIFGISTLQWPSVVATICFMLGGFFVTNLVLPFILRL